MYKSCRPESRSSAVAFNFAKICNGFFLTFSLRILLAEGLGLPPHTAHAHSLYLMTMHWNLDYNYGDGASDAPLLFPLETSYFLLQVIFFIFLVILAVAHVKSTT